MQPPYDLLDAATQARENAFAPYSGFKVGAAIRASDGRIFPGCNIENASYGLTMCSERVMIGCAVAQGARSFTQMVIVTDTPNPTPPCGACRQVLFEFAPRLEIWTCNLHGKHCHYFLNDLLPDAFGPYSIQLDSGDPA